MQDLPRGTLPFASSLHRAGIEGVSVFCLCTHAASLLWWCRPQLQCIIRVILILQCSAALKCQLEILTMLLAAGHILGPVAGVGLLVVKEPANAELLGCRAWREQGENVDLGAESPPWTRLALSTSRDSHRSSRSSSACRKSRGQRCRRASRSAQCSVADLGGWVLGCKQVGWGGM